LLLLKLLYVQTVRPPVHPPIDVAWIIPTLIPPIISKFDTMASLEGCIPALSRTEKTATRPELEQLKLAKVRR
jgi:hypothetical protein